MTEETKLLQFRDVCTECGLKLYGPDKREMGAITVAMGKCEECGKRRPIIPARDWYYSHAPRVTTEDWD